MSGYSLSRQLKLSVRKLDWKCCPQLAVLNVQSILQALRQIKN